MSEIKKQPNARHQPPRRRLDYSQASRIKVRLLAFGCMPGVRRGCLLTADIRRISSPHRSSPIHVN